MKLRIKNLYTYVEFEEDDKYLKDIFLKRVHTTIGARQEGFQYSPAYKRGSWDGYIDFYVYEEDKFPTGLLFKVELLLGELQSRYNFQFETIDERDESFLSEEDIDDEITLLDNNIGQITLRDYQYEAVYNSLTFYNGILHSATNCLTKDTLVLTNEGYKTIESIFKESGVNLDSSNKEHDIQYPLINRYGELEYTSKFFINGRQPVKEIKTNKGVNIKATYNHPMLVVEDNEFKWKKVEDLKPKDLLVSRVGDNIFGNDNTIRTEEEAYVLGVVIADGYIGQKHVIDITNDENSIINIVKNYFTKDGAEVKQVIDRNSTRLYIKYTEYVKKYHERYALPYGVAKDKEIPKCVMNAPKNIQLAFLSGYFECECSIEEIKKSIEVTSASKKLLQQIQLILFNIGVVSSVTKKNVKKYPNNYYGRLTISSHKYISKFINMLTLKTEDRNNKYNTLHNNHNKVTINKSYRDVLPNGKYLITEYRNSLEIKGKERRRFEVPNTISRDKARTLIREYPEGDKELFNTINNLVDENYFYQEIKEIKDVGEQYTFDVYMPKTHSFIAESCVQHNSGKTEIGAGIIDQLLPQLEKGERVAFFTGSTEIFHQSADRLKERLNIPIGKVGAGKFDVKQVTVVMIPTLNANLKDPTQGVKVTPKQNISKKIAQEILPKFEGGTNQKKLLKVLLENTTPKTKVEQNVLNVLELIYQNSKTDAEVLLNLKKHNAHFQKVVREKNAKKYDKYQDMRDFLDSVTVMIVDEAHHSKSDSWYNNLMTCENALYRIALTGSIDKKDELLWMRLQALFGNVIARTTNKFLIDEGHSARPTINIIPVANPNDIDRIDDYREAYDKGITNNDFRNKLIAKLTEKWYNQDKGTLIIVNFIEHGDTISEMLNDLDVEHYFLHGEIDSDTRREKLNDMRSGKLKVMIATSLIDEGVDISGINALILGAGGKSLRQTLQRIGRALRKKKDDNTTQIFDFNDMTNRFLYTHSKERRKIYEEEDFEIKDLGK